MDSFEKNTVYVFKNNEKMDCPENVIASTLMSAPSVLNEWFDKYLKEISENFFIQIMFSDGSIMKCFSGKKGHVKSVKLWFFNETYNDGRRLDYFLCVPKGVGSKHLSYRDFIQLLQNQYSTLGTYSRQFSWKTRSHESDTNPREPLALINLRLEAERIRQEELNSDTPNFSLERLRIKPYRVRINTEDGPIYQLISSREQLTSYLNGLFAEVTVPPDTVFPLMVLDFRNDQNNEQRGEVVYFTVGSINYSNGLRISCSLGIDLENVEISADAELSSFEELVDTIFFVPHCDNPKIFKYFKVVEVIHKKNKTLDKREAQEIEPFVQADIDKIVDFIDLTKDRIIQFGDHDNWLQLVCNSDAQSHVNFCYPFKSNPIDLLKGMSIDIPESIKLSYWEFNSVCTFDVEINSNNIISVSVFVKKIMSHLLGINQLSVVHVEDVGMPPTTGDSCSQ